MSSACSNAVRESHGDELLADIEGMLEQRRADAGEMADPLELDGASEKAGFRKVGDAVRVHTDSNFEVVLLLFNGDGLVVRPTQRPPGWK